MTPELLGAALFVAGCLVLILGTAWLHFHDPRRNEIECDWTLDSRALRAATGRDEEWDFPR